MMKTLVLVIFLISSSLAYCCDMFALLLKEDCSFSDYGAAVNEYFSFLRERSGAAANNDGYGIIAYKNARECDTWYKTGSNTWYGDGKEDALDEAEQAVLEQGSSYYLVIAHARNATGGYGSHPFLIQETTNTYSLCHNGMIRSSITSVFMEYLGEDWFNEHPSNWNGEFGVLESFIDSELYFHYLVNCIDKSNGYTLLGLRNGLSDDELLWINPAEEILGARSTANIIFSDGISLYAFRNTIIQSQLYKLSWEESEGFFAIKTQELLDNEMQQNELLEITRDSQVHSEILSYEPEEPFVPAAQFYSFPNPFRTSTNLYFQKQRDNDNNVEVIGAEKVKIYNIRGQLINTIEPIVNSSSESRYFWNGEDEKGQLTSGGVYFFEDVNTGKTIKALFIK